MRNQRVTEQRSAHKVVTREWRQPPTAPKLVRDQVHVWRASLDLNPWTLHTLRQGALSEDEMERAGRLVFQRDRDRFVAAHGILRTILGSYLGLPPLRLSFANGPQGKPALAEPCGCGEPALRFNMSHSHGLALFAVACEREVGVDVEKMSTALDYDQIARRFFAASEVRAIHSLPHGERLRAFFHYWTLKEAFLKAAGHGLTLNLDQFEVSATPLHHPSLLSVHGCAHEASGWSLRRLAPHPTYSASLAVEGLGWKLTRWQWPEEGAAAISCQSRWSPAQSSASARARITGRRLPGTPGSSSAWFLP